MIPILDNYHIVPVLYSADYSAGVDFDSINMAGYKRATFIIGFGAIVGDAILYMYSGADDSAKTSALPFRYAFGGAARGSANCDVFAATSTSEALTITGDTYDNYMLLVDVDASEMDMANGEHWLTGNLSDAADSGIAFAFALLTPRYACESSLTALS
jgi:hypothetical protein